MSELAFLPITELSRRIDAGVLDPRDLLQAYMRRADGVGRALNCYVELCRESAVAAAGEAAGGGSPGLAPPRGLQGRAEAPRLMGREVGAGPRTATVAAVAVALEQRRARKAHRARVAEERRREHDARRRHEVIVVAAAP